MEHTPAVRRCHTGHVTEQHSAEHRLATYGTLAPGRPNAHELAGLSGHWRRGTVRGHLHASGWGSAQGYPGIVLDDDAPQVAVHVLTSPDLIAHWDRLDAFEGYGYVRVTVTVQTDDGPVTASIYALAQVPGAAG